MFLTFNLDILGVALLAGNEHIKLQKKSMVKLSVRLLDSLRMTSPSLQIHEPNALLSDAGRD